MPSFSWEASPVARTYSSESKSVVSIARFVPCSEKTSFLSVIYIFFFSIFLHFFFSIFLPGTIRHSSKSHCAPLGCRYGYGAWCGAIWPSASSARVFGGCATVLHDESTPDAFTYPTWPHANRFLSVLFRLNCLRNRKIS